MFLNPEQDKCRRDADKLFEPGGLSIESRFLRKLWVKELNVPYCVPKNPNTITTDPYGDDLVNCDIIPQTQGYGNNYQTFNIAIGKLSLNFTVLPTTTRLIFITLDSTSLKPRRPCLSALSYPVPQNGTNSMLLFETIFTPPNIMNDISDNNDQVHLSGTLFNISKKRLRFSSIDINTSIPFDRQTLELGCWSFYPEIHKVVNLKSILSSFAAEVIICNEAEKMEYEAMTEFNLSAKLPLNHGLNN